MPREIETIDGNSAGQSTPPADGMEGLHPCFVSCTVPRYPLPNRPFEGLESRLAEFVKNFPVSSLPA